MITPTPRKHIRPIAELDSSPAQAAAMLNFDSPK
jgi:hypothetical protein